MKVREKKVDKKLKLLGEKEAKNKVTKTQQDKKANFEVDENRNESTEIVPDFSLTIAVGNMFEALNIAEQEDAAKDITDTSVKPFKEALHRAELDIRDKFKTSIRKKIHAKISLNENNVRHFGA